MVEIALIIVAPVEQYMEQIQGGGGLGPTGHIPLCTVDPVALEYRHETYLSRGVTRIFGTEEAVKSKGGCTQWAWNFFA